MPVKRVHQDPGEGSTLLVASGPDGANRLRATEIVSMCPVTTPDWVKGSASAG